MEEDISMFYKVQIDKISTKFKVDEKVIELILPELKEFELVQSSLWDYKTNKDKLDIALLSLFYHTKVKKNQKTKLEDFEIIISHNYPINKKKYNNLNLNTTNFIIETFFEQFKNSNQLLSKEDAEQIILLIKKKGRKSDIITFRNNQIIYIAHKILKENGIHTCSPIIIELLEQIGIKGYDTNSINAIINRQE